jgi:hypothetical protein
MALTNLCVIDPFYGSVLLHAIPHGDWGCRASTGGDALSGTRALA